MTTIETMIQDTLAQHPEIKLVMLFGSLVTGEGRHDSDVDLAIDVGQPLEMQAKMLLMAEIAESTGRSVDLIDLRAIAPRPARLSSTQSVFSERTASCGTHQAACVR